MKAIQTTVNFYNRYCCPPPTVFECFDSSVYRACLAYEQYCWRQIQAAGGIETAVALNNGYGFPFPAPPQTQMPATGQVISKINTIALPAADGSDNLVTSFIVPGGWDGVLISLVNDWTGTTLVPGSGDLTWRVQINNQWVPDYGNIKYELGDLSNRYPLEGAYMQLRSNDLVRYWVNHRTGSLLTGGVITCSFAGWLYPNTRRA